MNEDNIKRFDRAARALTEYFPNDRLGCLNVMIPQDIKDYLVQLLTSDIDLFSTPRHIWNLCHARMEDRRNFQDGLWRIGNHNQFGFSAYNREGLVVVKKKKAMGFRFHELDLEVGTGALHQQWGREWIRYDQGDLALLRLSLE